MSEGGESRNVKTGQLKAQQVDGESLVQQAPNQIPPIHNLPPELLLDIFSWALKDIPIVGYYTAMSKISLVSKTFHHLINQSPAMWSFISSDHSPQLVKRVLVKSKIAALTIDAADTRRPFLQFLPHHISHTRSLKMLIDFSSYLRYILCLPAPVLDELTLWTAGSPLPFALEVFSGQAPRLQHLTLHGVPLVMSGDIFSGLKSIEISNIIHRAPSVQRLLDIIANSPRLETLILENISFVHTAEDGEDSGEILLLELKTLRMELTVDVISTFLRRLQVTNCSRLIVQCGPAPFTWHEELPPTSEEHFDASLEQFATLVQSMDESSKPHKQMIITAADASVSFSIGDSEIDIPASNPYKVLEWITARIDVKRMARDCLLLLLPSLRILGNESDLYGWLDKLSCVTHLQIHVDANAQAILRYLGWSTSAGSTVRWPLPKMESLTLNENPVNPYEVLRMVQRRHGKPNGPKKRGRGKAKASNLPSPISMLDLSGYGNFNQDVYDELADLIGEDNVIWYDMNGEEDLEDELSYINDEFNSFDEDSSVDDDLQPDEEGFFF